MLSPESNPANPIQPIQSNQANGLSGLKSSISGSATHDHSLSHAPIECLVAWPAHVHAPIVSCGTAPAATDYRNRLHNEFHPSCYHRGLKFIERSWIEWRSSSSSSALLVSRAWPLFFFGDSSSSSSSALLVSRAWLFKNFYAWEPLKFLKSPDEFLTLYGLWSSWCTYYHVTCMDGNPLC